MHHVLVRELPYTPEQLFALVGDVRRYPEFVPWVTSLRAWNEQEAEPGVVTMDAEAQVKFAVIRERFATHVRLDRPALCIEVGLISGPFRRLRNRWRFEPSATGSKLTFEIDFEFGSRFLQGLLRANFEHAVRRLVGCFEGRAKSLYTQAT